MINKKSIKADEKRSELINQIINYIKKSTEEKLACSFPRVYYHTTHKSKENNLEIKSIFSIITKNLENAFNFIQKADYFQGD